MTQESYNQCVFNPFTKEPYEPLSAADLQALITRQVAEGLYVEYKREFPSNNLKIARSIASFANSYGGWYIVGVESSKPDNVAANVRGIDIHAFPDPISKLRDTAKSHIDPLPAFFQQVVELSSNRSVLVVLIPSNQDKPFVTSDGRIYRRAADSSEPVFEKDRYTIDQLYREGRRFRKDFNELRREQFKSTFPAPTLDLLVMPYPNVANRSDSLTSESVQTLLERSRKPFKVRFFGEETETNLPLNTGYPTGESLIFRQASPESGHYRGTSVEFYLRDGTASFQIPLCFVSLEDAQGTEIPEVAEILNSLVTRVHLLDIGTSLLMVLSLVAFYLHWLGDQPSIAEFRFAFTLNGVRDSVPFFDAIEWAQHIEAFGLPICQRKQIKVPSSGWYSWEVDLDFPLWQMMAAFISYSVGMPETVFGHAMAASMQRAHKGGGKITSKWEGP